MLSLALRPAADDLARRLGVVFPSRQLARHDQAGRREAEQQSIGEAAETRRHLDNLKARPLNRPAQRGGGKEVDVILGRMVPRRARAR